jgi:hypothetical protein
MAKGSFLDSERRFVVDEETGARLIRLSGFPTINHHTYMHARCFTFDSGDAVFHSRRQLARSSPSDLFAVAVDGMNLRQLTERDGVGWMSCSPVRRTVLYSAGSSVWEVGVDDMEESQISRAPEGMSFAMITPSHDGRRILSFCNKDDRGRILCVDVARGTTEIIYEHNSPVGHLQLEPSTSRDAIFHDASPETGAPRIWCMNAEGSDPRIIYDGAHGDASHFVWLPGKDMVVVTLRPPYYGILAVGLGGEISEISRQEHFWHPGARPDGMMICSDTLIPDTGLHLIDPGTGAYRKLCLSKSSNSHPQWTHPHPTWSPDGTMVLFTSDWEGTPQVYLAEVPDSLPPAQA